MSAATVNEEEHFKKFQEGLSVIMLTSTPAGRHACARIKVERMKSSNLAMQSLIACYPHDQPIDVERLVKESMVIGKAMVAGFVEERLI